jgi:predicted acyl esterase
MHAGSKHKYLRFISGRHDLPFYTEQEVAVQKSFLDAFLKGEDVDHWTSLDKPRVDICVRKGNPGVNDAAAEQASFPRRAETEWPVTRTEYIRYHLLSNGELSLEPGKTNGLLSYSAPE